MRKIIIDESQNGKKLIQIITGLYPNVPLSSVYRALRQKDIKVNGTRIKADIKLFTGDYAEVYIDDSVLINEDPVGVVFEDSNIVVVNKPQGLKSHPDKEMNTKSLVEILQQKYGPDTALCHRLDRNTGGLLISAKNKASTEIILDKIKNNEIVKIYRCRVHGRLPKKHEELTAYHKKSAKNSLVFISDTELPGTNKIITIYDFISYDRGTDTSVADITLVTGKTHQIRAHMAHIGHPIVGDGKYGSNEIKKQLGEKHKYQALFAYKIIFAFTTPAGRLDYLKNELIEITPPTFV